MVPPYTFKLRKTAKWSDGKPVTAKDFVYSFTRLMDPASGAEYAKPRLHLHQEW